MAALTSDRNTARLDGALRQGAVAASTTIYAGAMVMRNATGFLVEGQTATGLVGVGRAEMRADNGSGADGDITCDYRPGVYHFANAAGADEIAAADIGGLCYAVDDQTVAKTDGSSSRSPAGVIDGVDATGVWVRMDEALTNAS